MFTQANTVVRTFVATIGALAVSSMFLFAAAGPAEARTVDPAAQVKIIDVVSSSSPIAY
jgi:hypothetical protein